MRFAIQITVLIAVAFIVSIGHAAEVTLEWDPHEFTDMNLIGYNIYYKEGTSVQSDPNASNLIYIPLSDPDFDPDHPKYTVTDLKDDTKYYFTVTAMIDDDESVMSNEVAAVNGASALATNTDGQTGDASGGGCFINTLE